MPSEVEMSRMPLDLTTSRTLPLKSVLFDLLGRGPTWAVVPGTLSGRRPHPIYESTRTMLSDDSLPPARQRQAAPYWPHPPDWGTTPPSRCSSFTIRGSTPLAVISLSKGSRPGRGGAHVSQS